MYDPILGRWHVPDPMAEMHFEVNPHYYCFNNPLLFSDPVGLDTVNSNTDQTVQQDDVVVMDDGSTATASADDVVVTPNKTEEKDNENSEGTDPKEWRFDDPDFRGIEPTYSRKDKWSESKKRLNKTGSDSNRIRKLFKNRTRPQLYDPAPLLNRKAEYGATGRLRTLGPGNSVIILIWDTDGTKVTGAVEIKYTGVDSTGNDNFEFTEKEF